MARPFIQINLHLIDVLVKLSAECSQVELALARFVEPLAYPANVARSRLS